VTLWWTALGQRQGRCPGVGSQSEALVPLGAVGRRGDDEVGWPINMSTPGVLVGCTEAVRACRRGVGSTMGLSNEVGQLLQ